MEGAAGPLRLEYAAPGAAPALVRRPLPPPGPGTIRLDIAACALNHADLLMAEGRYQERPEPPFTPGLEMAGTVAALGDGVEAPGIGARVVLYAGHGGLAEAANVPARLCLPVPEGLSLAEAAAIPVTYGTAHLALSRRARLAPGERLVVTGAAGGAGRAAVEIGALMGAEVVAVARGAERLEVARAAGARHLIDAGTTEGEALRDRVRVLGGADVVYDTVGGATWEALFRAANPEARLMPVGFAGGGIPQIPANHLLVKNLSVIGFYWGGYRAFAPEVLTGSLAEVLGWAASGRLAVHVGARYPLARAEEALAALRARAVPGKIVVEP
jgi:NADPH2:quinone reductase